MERCVCSVSGAAHNPRRENSGMGEAAVTALTAGVSAQVLLDTSSSETAHVLLPGASQQGMCCQMPGSLQGPW